jgi:hypothetical protein
VNGALEALDGTDLEHMEERSSEELMVVKQIHHEVDA